MKFEVQLVDQEGNVQLEYECSNPVVRIGENAVLTDESHGKANET